MKLKPLDWTDEELEELAAISLQDVEEARAWWERYAPKLYRELLNAQPEDLEDGRPDRLPLE